MLKDLILKILGLDKILQLLRLQILLQDATIRELAVTIDTLKEHIEYIESESDLPVWDRQAMRETLKIHYGNLNELKNQAAYYAGIPPIELINRINLVELEIDGLEQKLRHTE